LIAELVQIDDFARSEHLLDCDNLIAHEALRPPVSR
jgi:hypothetical protein